MRVKYNELMGLDSVGPVEGQITRQFPYLLAVNGYQYQYTFEPRDGYILASLSIKAMVKLECQRCLGELEVVVDRQSELALVKNHGLLDDLMQDYECVEIEEDIDLSEIADDELLLSIPYSHEAFEECDKASLAYLEKHVEVERKINPFSQLAELIE